MKCVERNYSGSVHILYSLTIPVLIADLARLSTCSLRLIPIWDLTHISTF